MFAYAYNQHLSIRALSHYCFGSFWLTCIVFSGNIIKESDEPNCKTSQDSQTPNQENASFFDFWLSNLYTAILLNPYILETFIS